MMWAHRAKLIRAVRQCLSHLGEAESSKSRFFLLEESVEQDFLSVNLIPKDYELFDL